MHCFATSTKSEAGCSQAARLPSAIQRKAQIGPVDDPFEREADQVADAVTSDRTFGPIGPTGNAVQRKCAQCEEEEEQQTIQRKCAACEAEEKIQRKPAEAAARAVSRGGQPLSEGERAYFEPRFGRDLSAVRIHTGGQAADAATAINARAYTLGSDIAFASGEYAPSSPHGKRLIAHELTHVVQQRSNDNAPIRRTVAATTNCPANTAGAPADPVSELQAADAEAQRMSLGASNVLALEALTFQDPTFGPSYVSAAYRRRFGPPPPAPGGRFRNRFDGRIFATEGPAAAAEMLFLSERFKGLNTFLSGNIRYRCPGTSRVTIGGCFDRCGANDFAWSCTPTDGRAIAICQGYWPLSGPQRAGAIVHESVHMRLNFGGHGSANANQRGRNPECYTSLILDLYRRDASAATQAQFNPADPKCPPV
ncbi:MAG: DUF4157 domain-containing protein [Mesorhizobium sp.]